ncbi:MAG: TAXI family TRAP transporter solute-binding subunit [Candidatus Bathyarchaeota archaeon]
MPKISGKALAIIVVVIIVVAAAGYFLATPPGRPMPTGKVSWTLGSCTSGSVGYLANAATIDIVERTYPEYFGMTLQVAGCAAAGHAAWDAGQVDIGYTAMNIVYQYATKTGRWAPEKATAQKYNEMSILVYEYPLIYTVFVTEDLKDQVTCWSDLKKLGTTVGIYPTPAAYASHEAFREAFSILFDVKSEDLDKMFNLQIFDVSGAADALTTGKVKVVWGYGDPGGPASWVSEAFSRVGYKLVAVPPSESELKKILDKSPDLVPFTMDLGPYNVKTRDGKTSINVIAVPFGLVGSKNLSKDHVYLLFKTHIERASEFEKALSTFKNYKDWFLSFNVECFKKQSKYGVSIHPGVAECLKEYGYNPDALGILVAKQ